MSKQRLAESRGQRWTRADDYVTAMARKRSARFGRAGKRRSESDAPRFALSTLPFLALILLLGMLAVEIMVVAFPGAQPQPAHPPPAPHELGVADRGWFQEAQKDFHR